MNTMMKTKLILLGLLLLLTGSLYAQRGQRFARMQELERRAEQRTEKMKQALSLTDAQTAQLRQLHADQAEKHKAAMREFAQARRRFQLESKRIRYEGRAKLNSMLTPEQQRKLDEMVLAEMQKRIDRRGPEANPGK